MKFGGTSVGDVAAFERVYHIVSTQIERRPVVVVSAMTKVTDALLNAFEIAKKGDFAAAFASLEPHFHRHVEVSRHFIPADSATPFDTELQFAREELNDLLTRVSRRSLPLSMLKDAIVSYGEQLSSRLLAEVLKRRSLYDSSYSQRSMVAKCRSWVALLRRIVQAKRPPWDVEVRTIRRHWSRRHCMQVNCRYGQMLPG